MPGGSASTGPGAHPTVAHTVMIISCQSPLGKSHATVSDTMSDNATTTPPVSAGPTPGPGEFTRFLAEAVLDEVRTVLVAVQLDPEYYG
jgi:hypothetical protein